MIVLALSLAGCGLFDWFDDDAHKPTKLTDIIPKITVTPLWHVGIQGAGRYFFSPVQVGDDVIVAGNGGDIARINASTGAQVWKFNADENLSAGVGADAGSFAVVTQKGEVITYDLDGKQRWRGNAGGEVLSPPGVGDGLVVVRTTDGRFTAFDSGTGSKRWTYQRQAQPLVLRTAPGMVLSSGILYAGLSGGRLIALTDINGGLRWDIPVSVPKGTTELERVADVMGKPVLANREICVASFQGRAGCYDTATGNPIWFRDSSSPNGVAVDARGAYIVDEQSVVQAFSRSSGASIWKNDKLLYRSLNTPITFDNDVIAGDYQGFLHFFSDEDGTELARVPTDGSAIITAPLEVDVADGPRLVVQTKDGGVFAFTVKQ
jgi:outer membrane protein assembly factor BamB